MLPALLRKAAGDAGFDLELGAAGGWQRFGVSGVPGHVWVRAEGAGALLALPFAGHLSELDEPPSTSEALPSGAAGAVACPFPAALFRALRRVRLLLAQSPPLPEKKLQQRLVAITGTEAESIVRRRVGQELFREALLEYWEGRCAVTGLDVPELLRASHAKPWKDATDAERLDVHNGLLLAVHLDALFDRGLLAFTDAGDALLSPQLPPGALEALGLGGGVPPLRRVGEGHQPYLQYHREQVLQTR
jgi:hypothetical protein